MEVKVEARTVAAVVTFAFAVVAPLLRSRVAATRAVTGATTGAPPPLPPPCGAAGDTARRSLRTSRGKACYVSPEASGG